MSGDDLPPDAIAHVAEIVDDCGLFEKGRDMETKLTTVSTDTAS